MKGVSAAQSPFAMNPMSMARSARRATSTGSQPTPTVTAFKPDPGPLAAKTATVSPGQSSALTGPSGGASADNAEKVFGDINGDGVFDKSDAQDLLRFLFQGGEPPQGLQNADVDGDGQVNLTDAIQLLTITQGQGTYDTTANPNEATNPNVKINTQA